MKKVLACLMMTVGFTAGYLAVAPVAQADGCSGVAPLSTPGCTVQHNPYSRFGSEPEPTIEWGTGFTGTITNSTIGEFGATKTRVCTVVLGIGTCSNPRWDHMQCCTEPWKLVCVVSPSAVGQWECDHNGG